MPTWAISTVVDQGLKGELHTRRAGLRAVAEPPKGTCLPFKVGTTSTIIATDAACAAKMVTCDVGHAYVLIAAPHDAFVD